MSSTEFIHDQQVASPSEDCPFSVCPSDSDRKRVLLVSYHFPPVGGAGVQRPVKFVKYLRQFGWDVSVLMAANPSVPLVDESLCADLPDDLVIERAVTWEPGYQFKKQLSENSGTKPGLATRLKGRAKQIVRSAASLVLQPDAQVLWLPNALSAAKRLLKRIPHDAILATAPPYSNLLLGGMLKKRFGLPLILDFRDEWDLSSQYLENSPRNFLALQMQRSLQRHILRRADSIIATTKASTARLLERAAHAGSNAGGHCIYNGFDPTDFPQQGQTHSRSSARPRFRLVYTGTLWNLTNVAPIVEAIECLHRQAPEVLSSLELIFVGRKTPQQRELLDRLTILGCEVRDSDYCPHEEALKLMRNADGLCLLLSDVPGAERVAPAKLFEYLAARRPMLAVTPQGETADIVRRFFPDGHFTPENVSGIADWICDQVVRFQSLGPEGPLGESGIQEFSRPEQARQLADVLNQVTWAHNSKGAQS